MTNGGAFLGVDASLSGRRWVGPRPETQRLADALAQSGDLAPPVAAALAARGVAPSETAAFLQPKLRDLLPDPRSLHDLEAAATRLLQAVDANEPIAIFADYDVDGGASAALLINWLRQLGQTATLYVPDRIDEGYGPNAPAMRQLAAGHGLIVCVDCGTLSHDAISAAQGAQVIVLDHHLGGETLPPALAVVNPNRQDESGALAHLCAAAVVFLTLVEANSQRRQRAQPTPDLMAMLDLVALATVADVAPLQGVNRAFVQQGLKVMAGRNRPGLVALSDLARMQSAPSAYHLGFLLGPRINAGGRIGKSDLGARLLASDNPAEAAQLAAELDRLNSERRALESGLRDAALAQAEAHGIENAVAWAAGDGWHPGVVGIVAARLKEVTNRPSVVIGFDGNIGKGSGRSVPGIDLGAAIQRLTSEGLLIAGGGHKMAAGLTVARDKLDTAMSRLSDLLAQQGADQLGPPDISLTGLLMADAASTELVETLDCAGPYGAAAPAPLFAFPDARITFAKKVGETHLRLSFDTGGPGKLDAIAFGAFDTAIGPALLAHGGHRFHLVGQLETNDWGGRRKPQLRLLDAAPAQSA